MEQALERMAQAQERGRRRQKMKEESKQMDVLGTLDVCVNENNMVVRKNSKKKMDVAKEDNGERLIK